MNRHLHAPHRGTQEPIGASVRDDPKQVSECQDPLHELGRWYRRGVIPSGAGRFRCQIQRILRPQHLRALESEEREFGDGRI